MTGVVPRFGPGPVTYEVAEAVVGGQLVEARANGLIGVAGATSRVVLGIATRNARPASSADGTTATGYPVTDLSHDLVTPYVAVGKEGEWPVTFTADAAFGVPVRAAANGTVVPWVTADGPDAIVGRCTQPGGVVIATNPVGLVKLSV